ncbi:ABC transporter ATP-binding protein [Ruegeria pomeroyi]|nr:ABC transporter ATP-binding protein [Ruegeria pomeroyi]
MLQLYAAIWRVSGRRQVMLIVLSLAIATLAAVPLEFQRNIVNLLTDEAIDAGNLFLLGAGMGVAILASLVLKFLTGFLSGTLGEHVIRLIRMRLVTRAAEGGNNLHQGTLTTAVSAEAEELGKFAGGAFADPVVQIGTLVSVIGYISSTQPGLGLIALLMILPQIAIVLLSQRQVNRYVARRVKLLRAAGNRLSEEDIAAAVTEVEQTFDEIYATRRNMFLWKLSTKFVISAINGAGTVAVLMLGGWLVLHGRTDVGTVVAAVSGLGRIQAPTAFLIAFYRQVSANRIKFELLRELFAERP